MKTPAVMCAAWERSDGSASSGAAGTGTGTGESSGTGGGACCGGGVAMATASMVTSSFCAAKTAFMNGTYSA